MTTLAEVLNLQPTEVLLAINADTIKSGSQIVTFVILDVMKSTADLGRFGIQYNQYNVSLCRSRIERDVHETSH